MTEDKFAGNIMKMYYSLGDVPSTMMDVVTTRGVIEGNSAAYGSGVWRTKLWGGSNRKYRALRRVISETRAYIKKISLHTDVRGERLIKTSSYMDIKTHLQTLNKKYWEAAEKFVDGYDDMVEKEKERLKGLADNIDYPTKSEVERRFKFDIWYEGIPDGDEILDKYGLKLSSIEADNLAKQVKARTEKTVKNAMTEAWRVVFKQVHDMAVKLANEDVKFRSTLISNIRDLVQLIPHLNMVDDPYLEEIRGEIEEKLLPYSAKELLSDKEKRAQVASDAVEITSNMASYFGRS